jgi:hypothetical protein
MNENPYASPQEAPERKRVRPRDHLPPPWPSYYFALPFIGGIVLAIILPTVMQVIAWFTR